jgi:ribosomal protein L7/L12
MHDFWVALAIIGWIGLIASISIGVAARSINMIRGMSRMESRLARLERRVDAIAAHVGLPPEPVPAGMDEVLALLADGRKIPAIKRYREVTGAGLREAKDAVDEIERHRAGA